jgi:hypothetical protein
VSQRNAPGAMSAMAFIVNPVNPKVGVILTSPVFSAIFTLLSQRVERFGNNKENIKNL